MSLLMTASARSPVCRGTGTTKRTLCELSCGFTSWTSRGFKLTNSNLLGRDVLIAAILSIQNAGLGDTLVTLPAPLRQHISPPHSHSAVQCPYKFNGPCRPTASAVTKMPSTRKGCALAWYLTSFLIGSGRKYFA
jgi:hypothetical protein